MPVPNVEVRALSLAVFAMNGRLIDAGNEMVAHLGLTSAGWQVLAALRYAPEPLPTASIARNMGLTRQAVQRNVDLLTDRGMVNSKPNPHHRRAKLIVLTDTGLDAVRRAERAAAPIDQAIAERVGDQRICDAVATLEAIGVVLAEELSASRRDSSDSARTKRGSKG